MSEAAGVPANGELVESWGTLAARVADRLGVAAVSDGEQVLDALGTYLQPWLAGEASAEAAVAHLVAGRSASSAYLKYQADLERMRTAKHEAGHAVAAWALGVGISYLTASAVPCRLSRGEIQFHSHGNGAIGKASAEAQAVIFLAGAAAEAVTEFDGASLSEQDYSLAVEAVYLARPDMAEAEGDALFAYCVARADALVCRYWPAVIALADALSAAEEIYGPEAVAIMESAMHSTPLTDVS